MLHNLLSLLAGHVTAKILSFFCLIFLAREFGVRNFGLYGTIMATLTLFSAIADGGLTTLVVRDISQDTGRSAIYFSHILILRLLLSAVAYGVMIALGPQDPAIWRLLVVGGLFVFPEALRKLASSMLSAYERMDIVAGLEFASTLVRYLPFLAVAAYGFSLKIGFLLLVLLWGMMAFAWVAALKKCCVHLPLNTPIQCTALWKLLRTSFPLGIFSILAIVYFKIDVLMLASLQGSAAVGFYDAAYRFIEASMFIPVSLATVLLPSMSRNIAIKNDVFSRKYLHTLRFIAIAILPVILGVSFFAEDIILLVYGPDYLPSAKALAILVWALFFLFINAPAGNLLVAAEKMGTFLPYAIGNTTLNILLNLWLIPKFGFLGAAATTVFTEFTGFFVQLYFVDSILQNGRRLLSVLGKLLITGIFAAVVMYWLKERALFPLNLLGMLAVYGLCLWPLKLIRKEDKDFAVQLVGRIRQKL